MRHRWVRDEAAEVETATDDVVFRCAVCQQLCGFNKPGIGVPTPVLVGGVWVPPPDIDLYVNPCFTPEEK